MNPQLLTDAAAAVAAVVLILGVLKPLLDNMPAVANLPATTYNAFYQLLGFVLCFGVLLGLQASHGQFDLGGRWYYYVAAAFMAEIGSHVTYTKVKSSILAAMDTGAGQMALGMTASVAPSPLAPLAPMPPTMYAPNAVPLTSGAPAVVSTTVTANPLAPVTVPVGANAPHSGASRDAAPVAQPVAAPDAGSAPAAVALS